MIKIFHNPKCRKSRETLMILRDMGHDPQIIEYLKTPPSADELKDLLKKMNMKPQDLIRKGETVYKTSFRGKPMEDDDWIRIMAENPILIERPIVVNGNRTILGRPPERVKEIL